MTTKVVYGTGHVYPVRVERAAASAVARAFQGHWIPAGRRERVAAASHGASPAPDGPPQQLALAGTLAGTPTPGEPETSPHRLMSCQKDHEH